MKIALIAALAVLWGCQEIPQDARKPFAPEAETRSSTGADAALAKRAQTQDDYRMLNAGAAK
jgi:hypothetical protein